MESKERHVILAAVVEDSRRHDITHTTPRLARGYPGAEIHYVTVLEWLPPTGISAQPSATELLEEKKQLLDDVIKATPFGGKVRGHLSVGTPWIEIVKVATQLRADLIVIGTRDLGAVKRFFLGSVAAEVVKKAPCPVHVVRPVDYHSQDIPEIEPACPDCLTVQRDSAGAELFCARHKTKKHFHAHTYYEVPESFGKGWMNFQG